MTVQRQSSVFLKKGNHYYFGQHEPNAILVANTVEVSSNYAIKKEGIIMMLKQEIYKGGSKRNGVCIQLL